jgi:3-oxoacyl-[acyl-carrier-protein] synthase III
VPHAKITSVGCYAPPGLLTNADLEKLVNTSDEWIMERTGIAQRHIAAPDMATSDMAVEAATLALQRRGMAADELEAIIVGTVTPDMLFPSTACLVQDRLQIPRVWGFDLFAGCCGYLYSLSVGAHLVMAGTHKKVMVIGADTMSRIIDYQDRGTCVLFGDAAGAVILEPCGEEEGMLDLVHYVDGSGGKYLMMPAGGSRLPASEETVRQRLHYAKQDGPQVYKFAVRNMYEACADVLRRNGFSAADVDLVIPHQANLRIITATADRLGVPLERVMVNIERYGNTTGGTIPLATEEALSTGRLKKGDLVLFAAVGAGYTAGASLWRWAY